MKESQEIPWKRIFVEATAIVASILLAFAIDAWWQNRTERIVETQYLQALRADLHRSLQLLDEIEAQQRLQVGYLESLLLTNGDNAFSDELRRWIDDGLFNVGTYKPQISALRDLESSGQTQIIQNQDLRRVLASIRQRMDGLETVQRDFQQSQQMLIDTYLVDNFNLSALMPNPTTSNEPDLSMLGTSDFQSRVAFKITLRGHVSQSQHEVRAAFNEALELIDTELDTTDGS
tara:strand:+ start:84 stop:782 length:699 start_codon:yes stop_codon:yes gene_type:complete